MLPMLRFRPLIRNYRWGGTRLQTLLGRDIGTATDAAESWEISDMGADRQSHVRGGPLDGVALHELMSQHRHELLGRHAEGMGKTFPLLVKFLDAHDRLSVQVHPNDEQAAELRPGSRGKTEAWFIVAAEPDSKVWAGLKEGISRADLQSALDSGRTGDVEACLQEIPVQPGDCLSIPAGTVHALGEGIVLAEVQQASDVTFRLFDWERVDAHGQPRQLHLAEGLTCVDFHAPPVKIRRADIASARPCATETAPRWTSVSLVAHSYFEMIQHSIGLGASSAGTPVLTIPTDNRCRVLIGIAGSFEVRRDDEVAFLKFGDVLMIPAKGARLSIRQMEAAQFIASAGHSQPATLLEVRLSE